MWKVLTQKNYLLNPYVPTGVPWSILENASLRMLLNDYIVLCIEQRGMLFQVAGID